jgi:hypothetical protein
MDWTHSQEVEAQTGEAETPTEEELEAKQRRLEEEANNHE